MPTTPWTTIAAVALACLATGAAAGGASTGGPGTGGAGTVGAGTGGPPPTVGGVWTWTDAAGRLYFGDTPPAEPGLRAAPGDASPPARREAAPGSARTPADPQRRRPDASRER